MRFSTVPPRSASPFVPTTAGVPLPREPDRPRIPVMASARSSLKRRLQEEPDVVSDDAVRLVAAVHHAWPAADEFVFPRLLRFPEQILPQVQPCFGTTSPIVQSPPAFRRHPGTSRRTADTGSTAFTDSGAVRSTWIGRPRCEYAAGRNTCPEPCNALIMAAQADRRSRFSHALRSVRVTSVRRPILTNFFPLIVAEPRRAAQKLAFRGLLYGLGCSPNLSGGS
jgi:hypothetical protein